MNKAFMYFISTNKQSTP